MSRVPTSPSRSRPRAFKPRGRREGARPRVLPYVVLAGVALAYSWGYGPRSFSLASAAPAQLALAHAQNPPPAGLKSSESTTQAGVGKTSTQPPLTTSLDLKIEPKDIRFDFHVTNVSDKKLEVNFPNGQTYDVVVTDAVGREVWRWSVGQLFTQALRNQPLDSHQTLSYTIRWRNPEASPLAHGPLNAKATLTSQNYPLSAHATLTLP